MIRYASLYIDDKKESISFYTQHLDFTVFKNVMFGDYEQWWILKKKEQQEISLILIWNEEENPDRSTLILNTNDCILEYCRLKDNGFRQLSTPLYSTLGMSFYFYDPAGNKIVVIEERAYNDPQI
ncbi:VOC family protein [Pedobacter polaris]|nr:VOC family protein [Pedobacter polaris]